MKGAARVAAGILVTRVLGYIRERVFAHYFGNGAAADAFRAALRIPNALRNLLGPYMPRSMNRRKVRHAR